MVVWESHFCLPLHPRADFGPLRELRKAGVNYASVNVGMDMNPLPQVMRVIAAFRRSVAAAPEEFVQATGVADVLRARREGKLAVGFDLEGAMPLMGDPSMAFLYRDLGVRQIHLAYNRNNDAAGGCHDKRRGLTALGRKIVAAVNDAGMLMDCSHTGRACSLEIMAASRHPVIFSHSNPASLVEHGRNVTDEQIRAAAATGGVICVSGVSAFVGAAKPGAGDVARHAAYVADLVGPEHVGVGFDISRKQRGINEDPPPPFDPHYWWPRAAGYNRGVARMRYPDIGDWKLLPRALSKAGMSKAEIAGIMGGNMLRVAAKVWNS